MFSAQKDAFFAFSKCFCVIESSELHIHSQNTTSLADQVVPGFRASPQMNTSPRCLVLRCLGTQLSDGPCRTPREVFKAAGQLKR